MAQPNQTQHNKFYEQLLSDKSLQSLPSAIEKLQVQDQAIFPIAKEFPDFFQHNLVSPSRVIKVLQGEYCILRAFYFQLFKLLFQIQNDERDYLQIFKEVIFDPNLFSDNSMSKISNGSNSRVSRQSQNSKASGSSNSNALKMSKQQQREILNCQKMLAQFIELVLSSSSNNHNQSQREGFEAYLSRYPVVDQIMLILLQEFMKHVDQLDSMQAILEYFCQIFQIQLVSFDNCFKFEESDVFLYVQERQEDVYIFLAYNQLDEGEGGNTEQEEEQEDQVEEQMERQEQTQELMQERNEMQANLMTSQRRGIQVGNNSSLKNDQANSIGSSNGRNNSKSSVKSKQNNTDYYPDNSERQLSSSSNNNVITSDVNQNSSKKSEFFSGASGNKQYSQSKPHSNPIESEGQQSPRQQQQNDQRSLNPHYQKEEQEGQVEIINRSARTASGPTAKSRFIEKEVLAQAETETGLVGQQQFQRLGSKQPVYGNGGSFIRNENDGPFQSNISGLSNSQGQSKQRGQQQNNNFGGEVSQLPANTATKETPFTMYDPNDLKQKQKMSKYHQQYQHQQQQQKGNNISSNRPSNESVTEVYNLNKFKEGRESSEVKVQIQSKQVQSKSHHSSTSNISNRSSISNNSNSSVNMNNGNSNKKDSDQNSSNKSQRNLSDKNRCFQQKESSQTLPNRRQYYQQDYTQPQQQQELHQQHPLPDTPSGMNIESRKHSQDSSLYQQLNNCDDSKSDTIINMLGDNMFRSSHMWNQAVGLSTENTLSQSLTGIKAGSQGRTDEAPHHDNDIEAGVEGKNNNHARLHSRNLDIPAHSYGVAQHMSPSTPTELPKKAMVRKAKHSNTQYNTFQARGRQIDLHKMSSTGSSILKDSNIRTADGFKKKKAAFTNLVYEEQAEYKESDGGVGDMKTSFEQSVSSRKVMITNNNSVGSSHNNNGSNSFGVGVDGYNQIQGNSHYNSNPNHQDSNGQNQDHQKHFVAAVVAEQPAKSSAASSQPRSSASNQHRQHNQPAIQIHDIESHVSSRQSQRNKYYSDDDFTVTNDEAKNYETAEYQRSGSSPSPLQQNSSSSSSYNAFLKQYALKTRQNHNLVKIGGGSSDLFSQVSNDGVSGPNILNGVNSSNSTSSTYSFGQHLHHNQGKTLATTNQYQQQQNNRVIDSTSNSNIYEYKKSPLFDNFYQSHKNTEEEDDIFYRPTSNKQEQRKSTKQLPTMLNSISEVAMSKQTFQNSANNNLDSATQLQVSSSPLSDSGLMNKYNYVNSIYRQTKQKDIPVSSVPSAEPVSYLERKYQLESKRIQSSLFNKNNEIDSTLNESKGTFYKQFTNTKIMKLLKEPYQTKVHIIKNRFRGQHRTKRANIASGI